MELNNNDKQKQFSEMMAIIALCATFLTIAILAFVNWIKTFEAL
jgi:hypothetical protein